MKNFLTTIFFLLGAITMLVMSIHYFQLDATGIMKGKSIAEFPWYRLTLRTHIFFGIMAISIGPFQFIEALRKRYSRWHRRLGYLYFWSIMLGSVTGLVVAQYAMGGWVTRIGFSMLAVCWFVSTLLAIKAILKKDVLQHKKWMFISYGLTFAAIPQRTLLAFALLPNISFMMVYQISAWLPWILNTGIAILIFNQTKKSKL